MDQLTFTEPLQPKDLAVRLKWSWLYVGDLSPRPNDVTCHVLYQILIQRIQIILQILSRLPQPKILEPIISNQATVEPAGCYSSRYHNGRSKVGLDTFLAAFLPPKSNRATTLPELE
ncbi:hypothetical protein ES288_D04G159700v1 [Gossypium darwinii]|uniref:Uncharacterized protein n=1 Tax=Gossypium darwinii TaxID=34276 RepID=A0A5D2D1J3_GOSDA|nr:hypothetical protein ES288_D04G159700v1 [Gossypium darwinii]